MRTMLKSILLTLFLVPITLLSQDISGMWVGKIEQIEGGLVTNYKFRMDIQQKGKKVSGTSYVSIPDRPELFAEMTFTGKFDDGVLEFREDKVTRQEIIMLWEWCIKEGTLTLDTIGGNIWTFRGPWKGGPATPDCPPGKVILEREVPESVVEKEEPKTDEETIGGRKVVADQQVELPVRKIKLLIWDSDKVDGDIISLYFNGETILKEYKLKRRKKELILELEPGMENTLALYALNQGRIPPNTAALLVWDGSRYRNMKMQSDLEKCGAIKFSLKE